MTENIYPCWKSNLWTAGLMFFSLLPLCPLCLRGENAPKNANHKDSEKTEVAQRRSLESVFSAAC